MCDTQNEVTISRGFFPLGSANRGLVVGTRRTGLDAASRGGDASIVKEVVKEESLAPPGWVTTRAEELLDRELRIAERERDISKREENVNRREHDASRRESWIMRVCCSYRNSLWRIRIWMWRSWARL